MLELYSPTGRVCCINQTSSIVSGRAVVYVMSRDQRVCDNHALAFAQTLAIERGVPLYVLFILYDRPVVRRAREHLMFMLRGLREVERDLGALHIGFELKVGDPMSLVPAYATSINAAAIVLDASPLRAPRKIAQAIASVAGRPVYAVDAHNIVPLAVASRKQEIGARTLRPKIKAALPENLRDVPTLIAHPHAPNQVASTMDLARADLQRVINAYKPNNTDISRFVSGEYAGSLALEEFIRDRFMQYASKRNDPSFDGLSELSPYLHFGQLSTQRVLLDVMTATSENDNYKQSLDVLIEEMVVRKELSDNFCYYNENYDNLLGAPKWAQITLERHAHDTREYLYTLKEFEDAQTHDPAWNAAQLQLRRTGKMHGYMRMYWAKKVLEWSLSPDQAMEILVYLNDFYSIDGGDPNGFVGILWSVAGLHDRPWGERSIYGTVRSMVYAGLRRKFDIDAYCSRYIENQQSSLV